MSRKKQVKTEFDVKLEQAFSSICFGFGYYYLDERFAYVDFLFWSIRVGKFYA